MEFLLNLIRSFFNQGVADKEISTNPVVDKEHPEIIDKEPAMQ